ncbi:DMT family transporter [soil metagenome]
MEIILGLGSAMAYGAADFIGGLATRRDPALAVVLLSQVAGSCLLLAALPILGDGAVSGSALGWGGAAGLAGSLGVTALYRGLAIGRMSVVAPVTAVIAATVPVIFGILSGERPNPLALAGVGIALAAVGIVSMSSQDASEPGGEDPPSPSHRGGSGLPEALGAGLAFGAFFILLQQADADTGLWPLVGARIASVALMGVLVAVTTTSLRPAAGNAWRIAAAGVLDVIANVLYLLAGREGLLSLVAVLTAMYPVSTVILARAVLGERLTRFRLVGLAAAGLGVVLIATG